MEDTEVRITATILSAKPRKRSWLVSVLAVMAIVVVAILCWRDAALFQLLSASSPQVFMRLEYWRLLSSVAVHADLAHLTVNSLYVLFFGYVLYGYFGFSVYPAAMLILASLTTLLSLLTYPPEVVLIGASGLVCVMMSFWLVVYACVERTVPLKKRLLRIVGIAIIVLVPTAVRPEVSYRTHFIGCGVGGFAAIVYFAAKKNMIRSMEVIELEPPEFDV